jgi:hypothetical protein
MLGDAVSRKSNFIQEALPGMPARYVTSGPAYIPPVRLPKTPKRKPVEQLAMYKTPKEIMSEYNPLKGDIRGGETPKDTWKRKADEGRTGLSGNSRNEAFSVDSPDTLENSIRREGVQNPVTLEPKDLTFGYRPEVFGGHHRIATANKINPDMLIPVTYSNTLAGADTYNPNTPDDPRFPVAQKKTSTDTSTSNKS